MEAVALPNTDGAIEIATKMLKKKNPVSDISEMTGLPLEQILELQKQFSLAPQ